MSPPPQSTNSSRPSTAERSPNSYLTGLSISSEEGATYPTLRAGLGLPSRNEPPAPVCCPRLGRGEEAEPRHGAQGGGDLAPRLLGKTRELAGIALFQIDQGNIVPGIGEDHSKAASHATGPDQ